jgi:hypothetical protein
MAVNSKNQVLCESCNDPVKVDKLGAILPPKIKGDKPRLYCNNIFCIFKIADAIEEEFTEQLAKAKEQIGVE